MNKAMKKKCLDLLVDTVKFYGKNPQERRAEGINRASCSYETKDGRRCAIGRLMKPGKALEAEEKAGTSYKKLQESSFYDAEDFLKEEYQDIPVAFLETIQRFHDVRGNWNSPQSTIAAADQICHDYGLPSFDFSSVLPKSYE
jgi:hypothetical protein